MSRKVGSKGGEYIIQEIDSQHRRIEIPRYKLLERAPYVAKCIVFLGCRRGRHAVVRKKISVASVCWLCRCLVTPYILCCKERVLWGSLEYWNVSNKMIDLPSLGLGSLWIALEHKVVVPEQQKQGYPKCSLRTSLMEPMELQSFRMHSMRKRTQRVVGSSRCQHPTYQLRRCPSCLGREQGRSEEHQRDPTGKWSVTLLIGPQR